MEQPPPSGGSDAPPPGSPPAQPPESPGIHHVTAPRADRRAQVVEAHRKADDRERQKAEKRASPGPVNGTPSGGARLGGAGRTVSHEARVRKQDAVRKQEQQDRARKARAARDAPFVAKQQQAAVRWQKDKQRQMNAAETERRALPVVRKQREQRLGGGSLRFDDLRTAEMSPPDVALSVLLDRLELVLQQQGGRAALRTLHTICFNIVSSPHDPKYRSLKVSNKAVAKRLLPVIGAVACLDALGFRLYEKDGVDCAVLAEGVSISKLRQAVELVLTPQLEPMAAPATEALGLPPAGEAPLPSAVVVLAEAVEPQPQPQIQPQPEPEPEAVAQLLQEDQAQQLQQRAREQEQRRQRELAAARAQADSEQRAAAARAAAELDEQQREREHQRQLQQIRDEAAAQLKREQEQQQRDRQAAEKHQAAMRQREQQQRDLERHQHRQAERQMQQQMQQLQRERELQVQQAPQQAQPRQVWQANGQNVAATNLDGTTGLAGRSQQDFDQCQREGRQQVFVRR